MSYLSNKSFRKFLITSLSLSGVAFAYSIVAATPEAPTIVSAETALEIRKITPPKLDKAHLGKEVLCHRPMRNGAPKMEIEILGDEKVIAHNYGHGGSGWTLGPGSASYVNQLFYKSPGLTKDTHITIIGAGALGLFTAYDLIKNGYKNLTIVAEKFTDLTSHNAGGLLAPVSMNNGPEMQKIIDQIGVDAYKFYAKIANNTHSDFKKGAMIVPTYFEDRESSGLEPYVGKVMKPAKDVVLDFGNGTTRKMVAYDDGIFIDTAVMMASLTEFLKKQNVKFVQKKVKNFKEIGTKFIVNCSGLGSAELDKDKEMVSVQGHLIMLKDQNPADLKHMILVYFDKGKTENNQTVKRSFYMFPKHLPESNPNDVGVVGGTFIEGATAATPNNKEFELVIEGAKRFYGIKG